MAKAYCCDWCGSLIGEDDIRITLDGYAVLQNQDRPVLPKGFSIKNPEDFCSFDCLSLWATNEQKLLNDYIALASQMEIKENDAN